jgi:hypothetical protein
MRRNMKEGMMSDFKEGDAWEPKVRSREKMVK